MAEKLLNILFHGEPSNYVVGLLEDQDVHLAIGYWGCGNCANNFIVPNSDHKTPWCCPFCGSHDIREDGAKNE